MLHLEHGKTKTNKAREAPATKRVTEIIERIQLSELVGIFEDFTDLQLRRYWELMVKSWCFIKTISLSFTCCDTHALLGLP
tara:strand:+ start:741 stop:983 length:243 start_codon:yes stop_codon:yes gene_type:complete